MPQEEIAKPTPKAPASHASGTAFRAPHPGLLPLSADNRLAQSPQLLAVTTRGGHRWRPHAMPVLGQYWLRCGWYTNSTGSTGTHARQGEETSSGAKARGVVCQRSVHDSGGDLRKAAPKQVKAIARGSGLRYAAPYHANTSRWEHIVTESRGPSFAVDPRGAFPVSRIEWAREIGDAY